MAFKKGKPPGGGSYHGFQKGKSGNPGGRPKEVVEVVMLAREHSPEAIRALVRIMREGKTEPGIIAAANSILDRGYGKPQTTVNVNTKRDATDWSRAELVALLNDIRADRVGAGAPNGSAGEPDSVH